MNKKTVQITRGLFAAGYIALILSGCMANEQKMFDKPDPSHTGIDFNNRITENDTFNVLNFEYIYNGGGVGVGDINNDGLTDIFFAGNMVSSRLYLNQGNFVFRDITSQASVGTNLWCTGVAMADINQDRLLDIYVSTAQPRSGRKGVPNLLFLNKGIGSNGVPVFEEVAHRVGLADSSYSTQAAFLDYDVDGDLDMYLLTNALESYNRNEPAGQRHDGSGKSVDKLYRNEGAGEDGLPLFKDVSSAAGIAWEGWGLGICINDINHDGYPDIYAANDFLSNDHFYINQRNGTFSNNIATMLRHQEHNGMGTDIADINNDGLNDIIALDMMPEDNVRQKAMFSNIGYDRFALSRSMNYQDQYVRNVLQLNNGNGTFSDIGYLSGVYATDWSWSSLLADFDNDGYRDIFITNGYVRDVTDLDFVAYRKEATTFGSDAIKREKVLQEISHLKGVRKPNVLFRNHGNLTFSNQAPAWGLHHPSYSNGAGYADFDNDGDLDIVVSNLNEEAFLYRNNLISGSSANNENGHNFIRIGLLGERGNAQGLGARIWIYYNGGMQFAEHQLQRGYKSTVAEHEHFGLGSCNTIDSIRVCWPGGRTQVLYREPVNRTILLRERDAAEKKVPTAELATPLFHEAHAEHRIFYRHEEQDFVDFKQGQALLPHKHSQAGPGIAVGDIDGNGLEDFIVGGAAHHPATVFYQQQNETFIAQPFAGKEAEDMGLLLFDADRDGDPDLYCVSGSTEFGHDTTRYRHRFYRNNGKGKFTQDTAALPAIAGSGSCVVSCDYDHDGDLDLFVGGRVKPLRYPEPPASYVLNNDGKGIFRDVTSLVCPALRKAGMVTAALWTDYDNDGWTDLMVAGEWMNLTFFKNHQGRTLAKQDIPSLRSTAGWWNSLAGADFDNDGDTDYIAGNLGRNTIFQASENEPVCLYASDYDGNGSLDPVLCRYIEGREYPTHPRETLTEQIPPLRRMLSRYSIYGNATFSDIFSSSQLKDALIFRSTLLSTVYIENDGGRTFTLKALPVRAQLAPVFGIMATDADLDGNLDVVLAGNSHAAEPLTGHYDAGTGALLLGDGDGNFKTVEPVRSGFFVNGDAKALAEVKLKNNGRLVLVTQNRDTLKAFRLGGDESYANVPVADNDVYAVIALANGKKRKHEIYYGEGYLSSSTRDIAVAPGIVAVTVHSTTGNFRRHEFKDRNMATTSRARR